MSEQQYLAFEVNARRYCAPLLQIQEVKQISTVTSIPQSAPDMLGVINLRGEIVPLIDMHARLVGGIAKPANDHMICIIAQNDGRLCALWVDQVLDVMEFKADQILPIPTTMFESSQIGLDGIVAQNEDFLIVVSLTMLTARVQMAEVQIAEVQIAEVQVAEKRATESVQ